MLIDWVEDGYEVSDRGGAKACDSWWKAWEGLLPRLTSEMRRARDADETLGADVLLFNWTQDFSMELLQAAHQDARYAELGLRYLRELLDQFPDEDGLYRFNAQADQGEFLFRLGRGKEGERLLLDLIREHPEQAGGYCRLAEKLLASDPKRALALLEQARDYPVRDARDWDLDERLEAARARVDALAEGQADTGQAST